MPSDDPGFSIPPDEGAAPADVKPDPTPNAPKDATAPARKTRSKAKPSPGPKTKSAKAAEAAEGTADLVSQVGILVTPFTPLGGAYLLASSAEAERVAAHLAEVDPRVMAALTKARKVTAWSGAISLGVGFVGAVMLERNMLPPVVGEVPMGPANVNLGELHARLIEAGQYDRWATLPDDGGDGFEDGATGEAPTDGGTSPLVVG